MSSLKIAFIAFAFVFGSAMLGLLVRRILPERHVDSDSKDTVRVAMGLVVTLSALVLGLLVSTAKSSFDKISSEVTQGAANIVMLDRVLAQYGPETKEVRDLLKSTYSAAVDLISTGDESQLEKLDTREHVTKVEAIPAKIMALSPQNDAQRALKARALQLSGDMSSIRWLVIVQMNGGVPTPLLVVLVAWLSMIFAGWGLFAPRNPTVTAALLASALCVSGAIFIMLEMDRPLTGHIRISAAPLHDAINHLGQ